MKQILIVSIMVLFSCNIIAQKANIDYSPNWTLTDIDGEEHTLYDYLDKGMSVIINLASVYPDEISGQSWLYFGEGHLNDVYEDYGPGYFGTGEVMVFIMEVDTNTTKENILGQNSFGNWAAISKCPIINNDTITNYYPLQNSSAPYPLNYIICPDRSMHTVGWTTATGLMTEVSNCPTNEYKNNVSALKMIEPYGVAMYGKKSFSPIITIENNGYDSLVTLTIVCKIDGEIYSTKNWSGQINTYYSESIVLDEITGLNDGQHEMEILLSDPNGELDEANDDNTILKSFSVYNNKADLQVHFKADNFPSENAWEIRKGDEVIVSSLPYIYPLETTVENIALEEGEEYILKLTDEYADGMTAEQIGQISVVMEGVTIARIRGDDFTNEKEITFTAIPVGVKQNKLFNVELFPNPANDKIYIDAPVGVSIKLFDVLGKQVLENDTMLAKQYLDISNLKNGLYIVIVSDKETKKSFRLVKSSL